MEHGHFYSKFIPLDSMVDLSTVTNYQRVNDNNQSYKVVPPSYKLFPNPIVTWELCEPQLSYLRGTILHDTSETGAADSPRVSRPFADGITGSPKVTPPGSAPTEQLGARAPSGPRS